MSVPVPGRQRDDQPNGALRPALGEAWRRREHKCKQQSRGKGGKATEGAHDILTCCRAAIAGSLACDGPRRGGRVGSVAFDDADQQIEEKLPLGGGERREHAIVGDGGLDAQPPPERLALRREMELPHPPVGIVDAPFDKAHRMEPIDDEARMAGVDTHGFREPALVDSRLKFERDQRPVLQLHQFFSGNGFRNHGGTDLLKAARQGSRPPRQGRPAACRWRRRGQHHELRPLGPRLAHY